MSAADTDLSIAGGGALLLCFNRQHESRVQAHLGVTVRRIIEFYGALTGWWSNGPLERLRLNAEPGTRLDAFSVQQPRMCHEARGACPRELAHAGARAHRRKAASIFIGRRFVLAFTGSLRYGGTTVRSSRLGLDNVAPLAVDPARQLHV